MGRAVRSVQTNGSNTKSNQTAAKGKGSGRTILEKVLDRDVDHELRSARRYRYYVSIIMVASCTSKIKVPQMKQMIDATIRESDEFFGLSDRVVILMNHTDGQEALKALERLKVYYNGKIDLRYAVGSYPSDGGSTTAPLHSGGFVGVVEHRLVLAKRGGFGEVVASG